jgi:hypothetical protein
MDTLIQGASTFDELVRAEGPKSPYEFSSIFHSKGFFAKRLSKQKMKVVKQFDRDLREMLAKEERVFHVSWGIHYSVVEAYFLGMWHYMLNRRVLVFTDRRILILQADSRRKFMDLKAQVRYESITKIARWRMGVMAFALRDKTTLTLTGLPRRDRKVVREYIQSRIDVLKSQSPGATGPGIENLCPHCYSTVRDFPPRCRSCGGVFKSPRKAFWLSFLFPGLGDWYLGHKFLGVMEGCGALAMWAVVGLGVSEGIADEASSEGIAVWIVLAAVAACLFMAVHGVDALVTRHTARKGIYPGDA